MADRLAAKSGGRQRRYARRTSRSKPAASSSAPGASSATPPPTGRSASSSRATTCPAIWRANARRITEAYEDYSQLRVLRRPLEGVYLSLFLMMTLMILVSATWMGLYLAKRITRPVQLLAAGAREIGAGHLDHRIEPETRDEFGSLVEAFNTMAGELAASQRKLERSRVDMERKNLQLDERRRYIETVLERIATGVVSVGADGRVGTINAAALRLLEVDSEVVGSPVERGVRARGSPPARGAARAHAAGLGAAGRAGDRAGARRARDPSRGRRDGAPGGGRRASKARCWCSTT